MLASSAVRSDDGVARTLQAVRPEAIERELMRLALDATGARHGALFLWDRGARALRSPTTSSRA